MATLFYGALVAASLAGGPLKPQQLLPFPELVNNLPALDSQDAGSKPGAKNTPAANRTAISDAKKIASTPAAGRPIPVPGSAAGNGGPGATASATPPAEGTATTPAPHPSASVTRSPDPTATPSPHPGQTEATGSTALPGTDLTVTPGQSTATVPVGVTSTVLPTVTLSVSPGGSGTAAGIDGSVALPGAIAGLGLA